MIVLGVPSSKNWKVFLALSIIMPVGLLTVFKLTGQTPTPFTITETITLEPSTWGIERPNYITKVSENLTYENVTASYCGGDFSMNSTITVDTYFDKLSDFGESSVLDMLLSAVASVREGFVADVNVTFQENYTASQVYLAGIPSYLGIEDSVWRRNLSVTDSVDYHQPSEVQKAYLNLAGLNNPKQVSFGEFVYWVLRSPYNQSHLLEVDFQFTYFNGTVYKRVVQPFLLKIWPDNNNSFEMADELSLNQTCRAYIESSLFQSVDTVDYYKIWLENGTKANLVLGYLTGDDGIEVDVYDPNRNLVACLLNDVNASSKRMMLNIDETGLWYIKTVTAPGSVFFIYTVTVTVEGDNQ